MDHEHEVKAAAMAVAEAIGRRDVAALRDLLAPGFTHRTTTGVVTTADAFLDGVAAIPGTIDYVRVEQVLVDLVGDMALVTGTQHARVVVEGELVEERTGFVDCFARDGDRWRLRAAFAL